MAERIFFNNHYVEITGTRAIFGSKTYSINGITSTEVIEIPASRTLPILLLTCGLIFGLCCGLPVSITQSTPDKEQGSAIAGILIVVAGLCIAALAIIWMIRQKSEFAVLICTSAREIEAYVTYNRRVAGDIAHAINKAIISRD